MVKILFTCKAHAYIYGRKSMNECVNTLGDSLLIHRLLHKNIRTLVFTLKPSNI